MTRDAAAAAAVAVLSASNLAANRWLSPTAYVPWNVGVATGAVLLARRAGCSLEELGLRPARLGRSLTVGLRCAGLVAAGYGLLARLPQGVQLFRDERVTGLDPVTARWHLRVRIPLGTVLAEELVFRAALPALLGSPGRPRWVPGVVTSVLFGAWHALPAIDLAKANGGVARVAGGAGSTVPLAVGATAAAGALLHVLRARTGHVAAPVAVHLAANVLGFLGARLLSGERPPRTPRSHLPAAVPGAGVRSRLRRGGRG